jgi:hypothetical protein
LRVILVLSGYREGRKDEQCTRCKSETVHQEPRK